MKRIRMFKIATAALLAAVMAFTPALAQVAPVAGGVLCGVIGGAPGEAIADALAGLAPNMSYAAPGTIKVDEEDCAYICAELGLLRGEGHGVTDEYLAKDTQRIQAAYLTLRLVGKESEAEKYTGQNNFNDVGHIYEGGQRRTAYLRDHSKQYGWEGDGSNNLMPNRNVTAQQFYKVLLTVLGYQANVDYPYEDTLEYAENTTGMRECRYISGNLTNDDIAIMMVEALLSYMRDETYTLAEFLAEEGVIDYDIAVDLGVIGRSDIIETVPNEPAPPNVLKADPISAVNYAEIDIKFNQKIDINSIDKNYIKLNDSALLATDYLLLQEDGLTLRIYRESGFVTQQGQRLNISVSKIRSAAGAIEMTAVTDYEIVFYDREAPTLADVQAIGLRRVKLVFSEPIRTTDSAVKNYATYKFNGRVMSASDAAACNGREVYLNFSSPLEVGQNKLTIDKNRIYDLAGFPIIDVVDRAFSATDDRTAPEVVSVEAWREKIIVTFSKEVRDQLKLYWLDGTVRRNSQPAEKDPFDRNRITFMFFEGQYLPVSASEIVIEGIVDMNGNNAADYRTTVNPKFDTDRPAVVSVESPAINEIVIGFSKPVKLGTSNNGRFVLKNSNYVTLSVNVQPYTPSGASAADTRYIKLIGSIPADTYTLTNAGVEDMTAQANRSVESTHSVKVADTAPPQVIGVSANIAASKVVIVFNKQLDWNSSTDPANYQYYMPGRGHMPVPAGTTAFLEGDGRTVVLTFPAGGWAVGSSSVVPNAFSMYVATNNADELRLWNIMDTNRNAMDPTLIDVPGTNEVAAKLLASAYAVTPQRIMMRFEPTGSLPINAASQDFIVRAGSQNLPFRSMSYNSINPTLRELYIDFDSIELNTDATYGNSHAQVTVSMALPNQVSVTKTALGTPIEIVGGANVNVTDNIKPGLYEAFRGLRASSSPPSLPGTTYPQISRDQILIVFDERVQFPGAANAAQLVNILDVKLESQPGSAIDPSRYTVEAYTDALAVSSSSGTPITRMIVVTLSSGITEAVNVSVRANSLWDGNKDANGLNVMNGAFDTGLLGAS